MSPKILFLIPSLLCCFPNLYGNIFGNTLSILAKNVLIKKEIGNGIGNGNALYQDMQNLKSFGINHKKFYLKCSKTTFKLCMYVIK